jgi:hypothetical protein
MKRAPSGALGPKSGIIPLVKEYPSLQFFIFYHGPSATARRVQLLLPFPGKFNLGRAAVFSWALVVDKPD